MAPSQSKWFPDLTADASPSEAARIVLGARCITVQEQLDQLVNKQEEPEPVHQTRVATRRLAAALTVFEAWLDPTCSKRLRKAASRIRREAGAVRDSDVGMCLLRERLERAAWIPPELSGQTLEYYQEEGDKARRSLLRDLPKVIKRFGQAARDMERELRAGRLDLSGDAKSLGALAATILRDKAGRLSAAGSTDLTDADNVHQLRIAAKRLRYAMEIFAACFSAEFRDKLYVSVERLQGELGDLNDIRHLYGALIDLRSTIAANRGRHEREQIKTLFDRFTAGVGHEWVQRQQAFAERWAQDEGRDLAAHFDRLLESEAAPTPEVRPINRAAGGVAASELTSVDGHHSSA